MRLVERASNPVEQMHRVRVLHAVMHGDPRAVKTALLEIGSPAILSRLLFIVCYDANLVSFVYARIAALMRCVEPF